MPMRHLEHAARLSPRRKKTNCIKPVQLRVPLPSGQFLLLQAVGYLASALVLAQEKDEQIQKEAGRCFETPKA